MATKKTKEQEKLEADSGAVALLIADHRRVAKLFADFKHLKDERSEAEKAAVVEQICQELIVHCAIEEEIFYPAVRRAIEDDDLMDEALVEQAGAKDLVAQLQAAQPDDELYDAKVTVLGEQIDHHVLEEEGNMFAQARGAGIDTSELASAMAARKAQLQADSGAPPAPRDGIDEADADEDETGDEDQGDSKPRQRNPSPRGGRSAKKTTGKTSKTRKR